MDKAPDAFRTISEVADELDVPQHVLRFWETRFSQIRPMKRGGGRRYYRPDDLDLLRGIRHLLYGEGYTIRGVQRILRDQGVKFVQTVWQAGAAQPARNPADESEDETEEAAGPKAARESRGLFGLLSRREAEPEQADEPAEADDADEGDDADEADEADDTDQAEADEAPERRTPPPLAAERREPAPVLTAERSPAAAQRIEPSFAAPPQAVPTPPAAPVPPAAPAAIALSREDLRKLQASLHELSECRRLLDQVMEEQAP